MQCVQNSPGPPHIKFLPKQPLPRPRATYLASLSTRHPRSQLWLGPALARSFPNNFPWPRGHFHHTRCTPTRPAAPPLPFIFSTEGGPVQRDQESPDPAQRAPGPDSASRVLRQILRPVHGLDPDPASEKKSFRKMC